MGEIALSPIGLSMVNKLSPLRFASLMMGIWYLSTATANKFAGMLSGLYPEDGKVKSLFGYQIATMYDSVPSLEEITEDDARGRIKNRIFATTFLK